MKKEEITIYPVFRILFVMAVIIMGSWFYWDNLPFTCIEEEFYRPPNQNPLVRNIQADCGYNAGLVHGIFYIIILIITALVGGVNITENIKTIKIEVD